MQLGRQMEFNIVKKFDPVQTEKIQGYPVLDAGIPIQLMVHRRNPGRGWVVSEWTTGQRIDLPVTVTRRENAAQMAIDKIRTLPPGKLQELLKNAPKVNKKEVA